MAVKIYHVHPLVAGPIAAWPGLFARVRAMGVDHVCLASPFAPAPDGDTFVTPGLPMAIRLRAPPGAPQ